MAAAVVVVAEAGALAVAGVAPALGVGVPAGRQTVQIAPFPHVVYVQANA